jgi:integrase
VVSTPLILGVSKPTPGGGLVAEAVDRGLLRLEGDQALPLIREVFTAQRSSPPDPLHECRHTFASLMIAAGVNAKALFPFMGHANISITLDRYGHLMPGTEAEAASLLDTYLTADRGQGRRTGEGC